MRFKPAFAALLAVVLPLRPAATRALAENSTQAPPPSSSKFGGEGSEGDPNGAVRALGSADDSDSGKGKPGVDVPRLGGGGADRSGRLPAGTTGPSR